MLRIHTVSSGTDAKRYYAAADYYQEGQETVGQWGGKLAARLGLSGAVSKEAFERLCDNVHPQTGKPLTPRTNELRRVGYDCVFSAPKSFSVLEAFASPEERGRLLAAFDDSIRETLREEMEPDIQTRMRRKKTAQPATWCGRNSTIPPPARWMACRPIRTATSTFWYSTPPSTRWRTA